MILLQTVPNNINLKQLRDDVLEVCTKNNIQANIHNLHVWSHTTTRVFGTAHIKLIGTTIEEAQTAFTKVNLKPWTHTQMRQPSNIRRLDSGIWNRHNFLWRFFILKKLQLIKRIMQHNYYCSIIIMLIQGIQNFSDSLRIRYWNFVPPSVILKF